MKDLKDDLSRPNVILDLMSRRSKMTVWKSEKYEKLQLPRDIHVLVIKPGTDMIMHCSIPTISLVDENGKFEALSYMWGTRGYFCAIPTIRWFVCLDGFRFDVHRSLFGALSRLRLPDQERVVWIDSVCINQNDYEERGQQVRLMRHIYSKAEQVVIDLGGRLHPRATKLIDGAKSHENRLFYHLHPCGRANSAAAFMRRAWKQEHPGNWLRSTLGEERFSEYWKSVIALFAQKYWTRIWIIQEVALARKLKVYYDGESIEWEPLHLVQRVWQEFAAYVNTFASPNLKNWLVDVKSYALSLGTRNLNVRFVSEVNNLKFTLVQSIDFQNPGPWDIEKNLRIERASNKNLKLLDLLSTSSSPSRQIPETRSMDLLVLLTMWSLANMRLTTQ